MPQTRNTQRLKAKMRQLLIGKGLAGMSQNQLIQKCRTHNPKTNKNGFTGDDIRNVLQIWKQAGLVQCFITPEGYAKKPTRIWRATEEIKRVRL